MKPSKWYVKKVVNHYHVKESSANLSIAFYPCNTDESKDKETRDNINALIAEHNKAIELIEKLNKL